MNNGENLLYLVEERAQRIRIQTRRDNGPSYIPIHCLKWTITEFMAEIIQDKRIYGKTEAVLQGAK